MSRFTRAVRRLFLGPTDEEINQQVIAEGGPGYPIPPVSTRMPTVTVHAPDGSWLPSAEADARRRRADEYWTAVHAEADADPVPYSPTDPTGVTAASEAIRAITRPPCPHGRTHRCGRCQAEAMGAIADAMRKADPGGFLTAINHATEQVRRAGLPNPAGDTAVPDITDTNPVTTTHEDDPNPVTDSGVHALENDDYVMPTIRVGCPTCGTGHIDRTVNELLRESVALIPVDGGDMVIKEFYTRLLHTAPWLGSLFPRDLLTAATQDGASPGAMQRDKLLNAITGLAELYGASRADMEHLTSLLLQWGRSHAAFARPDGTVRGATAAEYELVGAIFIRTFTDVAGGQWKPEYEQAWKEAYDDASLAMRWGQRESAMTAPRYPRRDAHRA